ncbi:unnamed protein product, partial [Prorocentrum cordatum]
MSATDLLHGGEINMRGGLRSTYHGAGHCPLQHGTHAVAKCRKALKVLRGIYDDRHRLQLAESSAEVAQANIANATPHISGDEATTGDHGCIQQGQDRNVVGGALLEQLVGPAKTRAQLRKQKAFLMVLKRSVAKGNRLQSRPATWRSRDVMTVAEKVLRSGASDLWRLAAARGAPAGGEAYAAPAPPAPTEAELLAGLQGAHDTVRALKARLHEEAEHRAALARQAAAAEAAEAAAARELAARDERLRAAEEAAAEHREAAAEAGRGELQARYDLHSAQRLLRRSEGARQGLEEQAAGYHSELLASARQRSEERAASHHELDVLRARLQAEQATESPGQQERAGSERGAVGSGQWAHAAGVGADGGRPTFGAPRHA